MSSWNIGITGLQAAQTGIEMIGMNIANAATEGYHKQDMQLASIAYSAGQNQVGGGVEIQDIRRLMDGLLENEIRRQKPYLGQVTQELEVLDSIESALGTLDSSNLQSSLDDFFNALSELSAQPNSQPHRENVVWSASTMADHFRNLSAFLEDLKEHVQTEIHSTVEHINKKLENVTELNSLIHTVSMQGGNTNVVEDQRDQAINELAELLPVEITGKDHTTGTINLQGWGMPLVLYSDVKELKAEITLNNTMGVGLKSATQVSDSERGGELGGLLELYNEIIPDLTGKLDTLATGLKDELNALHVQGIGENGPFTSLTGFGVSSENFDEWEDDPISAGNIYLRMTNTSTGDVTKHAIAIDPDDHVTPGAIDSIGDLVTYINTSIPHLSASLPEGALKLEADAGYRFDFLPTPQISYSTTPWTGTEPELSGDYNGTENETFRVNIVHPNADGGDYEVGGDAGLKLQVYDDGGAGSLVAEINVGEGYSPGDIVDLADGLRIALPYGTLTEGEHFDIEALAYSDETGLLAKAGINTFMVGDSARNISVVRRVLENPNNFAYASGPDLADNINVGRMAALSTTKITALKDLSPTEYLRQVITGVGLSISTRNARQEGLANVEKQLLNQRDEVSGVDVNEEAAKLLMYEKMFQAMSKFISIQDQALKNLFNLV